ncbi:MAG: DNA-processing protein DprA [Candidatus Saccharibacteria bacterium]|nr:DNA-processing protein DprA [Candidatus Saccharibacteria bacterium]
MEYRRTDLSEQFLQNLYNEDSKHWENKPPKELWQYGNFPKRVDKKVVAIVGSRNCTDYGKNIAYKTAKTLAEHGFVVVSGLAYGIDSFAHRGCIDGGGQTVAVLGTPIDRIYPVSNYSLAQRIVETGGAIISEYAPGSKVHPFNFVYRNRVVSGLADALIIVEASDKSGTIHTAQYAVEQDRELYVVPGDINRPMSSGANRLIMDGGQPFLGADWFMDCMDPLWRTKEKKQKKKTLGALKDSILSFLSGKSADAGSIAESIGQDLSKVLVQLSLLELDGTLCSDSEGKWSFA